MSSDNAAASEARKGVLYSLGAFIVWGGIPSGFKLVADIPMFETLAHRVVWGVAFLVILISLRVRWNRFGAVLRSGRDLFILTVTSALLAATWVVFILAVNDGQILQVSLGYYINPLVSVLLGFFLLRERLSKIQTFAVALAAAGVLNQTWALGEVPWISLGLAVLFGFYGYARKIAKVEATEGLFVETVVLLPLALAYLIYLGAAGQAGVAESEPQALITLIFLGVFTAVPLLLFTEGARRLKLSTIGVMQYIAPTLHFFSAIFIWGEPLSPSLLVTFACIWVALALYSVPSLMPARRA